MTATSVSRERLMHVVKVLPAAPQILAHLGRLLLDMNSGLSDVTELLRRDAALTARIIRVANSALYNKGTSSTSLAEALSRVGFKEVYRLTGFAAVAQMSDQKLPFYRVSGAQLRENSLLTALVMEELASAAGIDPRLAYTAGLLRSMGKIALDRMLRDGPGSAPDAAALAEWEVAQAGMNNCTAAAIILEEWNFSGEMIAAIRDHYLLEEGAGALAHLLNLAAGEAERSGQGLPGEAGYWEISPEKLTAAGVDEAQLQAATTRADIAFKALRAVVA